jgi:hypothetical protein
MEGYKLPPLYDYSALFSLPPWRVTSNTASSVNPVMPVRYRASICAMPVRNLRDILSRIAPGMALIAIEELPTTRLPRVYFLDLSGSNGLQLSFGPSLNVKLLRHEKTLLASEAILVQFLTTMEKSEQRPSSSSSSGKSRSRVTESLLARLVPKLVKHSSNPREMWSPYTLFEPSAGVPLSTLSIYLSRPEQRLIDKQIGLLVRELAKKTSPSRKFGPASRVCEDPFATGAATHSQTPRGSTSWVAAFTSLMEGILRDGEDMSVLLPYEVIRMFVSRLSWRLSAVTVPRLLVMDAGEETNVLIERDEDEGSLSGVESIRITGLRDWSQGIFGDPLLCSCFENPSESFLEGWKRDGVDDIIEDTEGGRSRLLLYSCYRAVVLIVTQYYRSQTDSSRRELEGRRKLTAALAELEKVDLEPDGNKRGRSGSISGAGEGEAAKRLKLDSKCS